VLTLFTVSVTGISINLLWTTTTELNNRGFEIERILLSPPVTKGGKQEGWEQIAFVTGKGSSTDVTNYQYNDDYKYKSVRGIVQYRLKQIDFNGTFNYSDIVEVNVDFMPKEFVIYQNYPNPFNPNTKIKYALSYSNHVNLKVYNVIGEVVTVLVDEVQEEGFHEINFNAALYKSGVYFYRIIVGDTPTGSGKSFVETKKMLLLR